MKYNVTIIAVLVSMFILLTGAVNKIEMGPPLIVEKMEAERSYVEMKCDPCDYNIDYGDTFHPAEKGGIDEGVAKLACDPCDYNIDYGTADHTIKK